ncbi:MAG TPA: exodeoxyribonuclease III [Burkholderiaceae bacterium]|nr:exodeoxyribonuclease III [Burkholderiaceae bacterium]
MLRIVTANLNGIRSAATKGFFQWLASHNPHIVCTQELKAQEADLAPHFIRPTGTTLEGRFHYAQKKGYSGVGLHSALPMIETIAGFGHEEFDAEGRYLEARLDIGALKLAVVSLYLPSGSSSEERQQAKFRFLDAFLPHLVQLRDSGREIVLCGDWNIAHKEIDLKNWRGNLKNSGFLPEERAWLTHVFDELGFVDVFRALDPRPEQYTWWSQRGQARAKNVGWRIDYQIATPGIAARAKQASIYTAERFSDHAPLTIDYDVEF